MKAMINLRQQGFEVFFPRFYKPIIKIKKISSKIRPLFPGYLFVNINKNQKESQTGVRLGTTSTA